MATTLTELLDKLDPDQQVRGRQFKHICKWLLLNAPVYKSQIKRVWLWDDWPGRWGSDAGIDLVAETKLGELWASLSRSGGVRLEGRAWAGTTRGGRVRRHQQAA